MMCVVKKVIYGEEVVCVCGSVRSSGGELMVPKELRRMSGCVSMI